MPRVAETDSESALLNGCIGMVSKPEALSELARIVPGIKIIISLRNFADWSYSYYSYRCIPNYDYGCEELRTPHEKAAWKENRTAEKFKSMVKDIQANLKPPHSAFHIIRPSKSLYRPWLEKLVPIVGKHSLKIVRQEELMNRPRNVLREVAEFLEISPFDFPCKSYSLISNTNSHPSILSNLDGSVPPNGVPAAVNSWSAIDEETRSILNIFWKEECMWLRSAFNIHFKEAC